MYVTPVDAPAPRTSETMWGVLVPSTRHTLAGPARTGLGTGMGTGTKTGTRTGTGTGTVWGGSASWRRVGPSTRTHSSQARTSLRVSSGQKEPIHYKFWNLYP